ncbi:MAG: ribosomal protein [Bacteroidota bacterium]|jgi:large subunit ribosomal protein L18
MALNKWERRERIRRRIRKVVSGDGTRPRLSVFRSNKQIYAQLIDDSNGTTIVAASSRVKDIAGQKVTKIEQARLVGKLLAERAGAKGISTVKFDRGGFLYHGRVKSLADAAREAGLQF